MLRTGPAAGGCTQLRAAAGAALLSLTRLEALLLRRAQMVEAQLQPGVGVSIKSEDRICAARCALRLSMVRTFLLAIVVAGLGVGCGDGSMDTQGGATATAGSSAGAG